jgi:hypothetical protein
MVQTRVSTSSQKREQQHLRIMLFCRNTHSSYNPQMHEYQVIGRKLPTAKETQPKLYRMRLFAPNAIVAKSRFWYFVSKFHKMKRAAGEIVSVNEVKRRSVRDCVWRVISRMYARRQNTDLREEPSHRQDVRCVAPVRLAVRDAQHVQRIQGSDPHERGAHLLPGHGRPPPRSLPVDPGHPRRRRQDRGCPQTLHQAADCKTSFFNPSAKQKRCLIAVAICRRRTSSSLCRTLLPAPPARSSAASLRPADPRRTHRLLLRLRSLHVIYSSSSHPLKTLLTGAAELLLGSGSSAST